MNPPNLPRAYWCYADPAPLGAAAALVIAPTAAVDWMRESVRALTPVLGRSAFHLAWAWLGNHRERERAASVLRAWQPYRHEVREGVGVWIWAVHPVRVLPLLENDMPPKCVHWRTL